MDRALEFYIFTTNHGVETCYISKAGDLEKNIEEKGCAGFIARKKYI
jgi:hypothetical protein